MARKMAVSILDLLTKTLQSYWISGKISHFLGQEVNPGSENDDLP
jgi:hypothetical protein